MVSGAGIAITDDPDFGPIVADKDMLAYLDTLSETDRKVFVDLLQGHTRPLHGWYLCDISLALWNYARIQKGKNAKWQM